MQQGIVGIERSVVTKPQAKLVEIAKIIFPGNRIVRGVGGLLNVVVQLFFSDEVCFPFDEFFLCAAGFFVGEGQPQRGDELVISAGELLSVAVYSGDGGKAFTCKAKVYFAEGVVRASGVVDAACAI